MKRILVSFFQSFGMGEFLFVAGMLMLYYGVSALLSHPWAQAVCGFILIAVGFILGREGK